MSFFLYSLKLALTPHYSLLCLLLFTADALVDIGAAMLLNAASFDCAVAVGSDEDNDAIVVPSTMKQGTLLQKAQNRIYTNARVPSFQPNLPTHITTVRPTSISCPSYLPAHPFHFFNCDCPHSTTKCLSTHAGALHRTRFTKFLTSFRFFSQAG